MAFDIITPEQTNKSKHSRIKSVADLKLDLEHTKPRSEVLKSSMAPSDNLGYSLQYSVDASPTILSSTRSIFSSILRFAASIGPNKSFAPSPSSPCVNCSCHRVAFLALTKKADSPISGTRFPGIMTCRPDSVSHCRVNVLLLTTSGSVWLNGRNPLKGPGPTTSFGSLFLQRVEQYGRRMVLALETQISNLQGADLHSVL